jgi:DNA repair and recombination protein RAD52
MKGKYSMNHQMLSQPLQAQCIKKRKQGGTQLSYIEGYHAINKANEIFGYGNWNKNIVDLKCVYEGQEVGKNASVKHVCAYIARVLVKIVEPTELDAPAECQFEDVGYGNGISYNSQADAHELASKEAVTDGMKRALRHFGDQFGNCLYDKDFKPDTTPPSKPSNTPSKAPSKGDNVTGLPKMNADEKARMNRVWDYVNETFNQEKVRITPADMSAAAYATLGRWPSNQADEEHLITTVDVVEPDNG